MRHAQRLAAGDRAGSGTLQSAVIGCPSQGGQLSPTTRLQTVKTKSKAGAFGPVN
jgi:hypothetical protein